MPASPFVPGEDPFRLDTAERYHYPELLHYEYDISEFYEYQRLVCPLSRKHETHRDRIVCAALGLAGESGELVDHIKKYFGHGRALDRAKVVQELGDVLWYVQELGACIGVPLQEIAQRNAQKLCNRHPEGAFDPSYHNAGETETDRSNQVQVEEPYKFLGCAHPRHSCGEIGCPNQCECVDEDGARCLLSQSHEGVCCSNARDLEAM